MKLWFDMETRELVTEAELRHIYQDWLVNRVSEEGAEYVLNNHGDFTFEAYAYEVACGRSGGTLIPVRNAEHFKEVELNA